MAILNRDDTEFKTVDKVFKDRGNSTRIQRVWVHDGTKFILVKGRMYEVVWETDLSEWGGVSWDGKDGFRPSENLCEDMYILDDGNLLAVMPEYLNNYSEGCTNEGRYALAKFDANTGVMSKWGSSNWVSWKTSSNYTNYLQPHYLIKLPNYFVFYTGDYGIFYMYHTSGSYVSCFFNPTWSNTGDFKGYYGNRAVSNPLASSGNIYAGVQWGASYERTCCYRLGYTGSSLNDSMLRFHSGYVGSFLEAKPFYLQGAGKVLISYPNFGDYSYCYIVVLNEITSYSSTTVDRPALVSLKIEEAIEIPLYYKDGYIYLYHTKTAAGNPFTIVKRNITDLSLVWEVSIEKPHILPHMYGWSIGCKKTCEPYGDNAFITDFGLVVYENGRTEISNDYTKGYFNPDGYGYDDVHINNGAFNQEGGYAMIFNSTDKVCCMLKLKEVRK